MDNFELENWHLGHSHLELNIFNFQTEHLSKVHCGVLFWSGMSQMSNVLFTYHGLTTPIAITSTENYVSLQFRNVIVHSTEV